MYFVAIAYPFLTPAPTLGSVTGTLEVFSAAVTGHPQTVSDFQLLMEDCPGIKSLPMCPTMKVLMTRRSLTSKHHKKQDLRLLGLA